MGDDIRKITAKRTAVIVKGLTWLKVFTITFWPAMARAAEAAKIIPKKG